MVEPLQRSFVDTAGNAGSFAFEVPLHAFVKADAPIGKQRRIGGVISTENVDRQGETILQNGLDFSDFIANGWYNDNHTKATDGILGYPEMVQQYQKGQILPDGTPATANCTWAEGYLLDDWDKANEIWKLAQSLNKTGRRLGFSVEGSILKRRGPGNKTIVKANVRNVAVTNCPVNVDSRLEVLARSMAAIAATEDAHLDKTLTVGSAQNVPVGTDLTGQGAGRVLEPQDLEQGPRKPRPLPTKRKMCKSLSHAEAVRWVVREVGCPVVDAVAVVQLAQHLPLLTRLSRR